MKTANIVRAYLCTTEEIETLRESTKLNDLVDGLAVFLDKLQFDTKEVIVPNKANTKDDIITEVQGTIDTMATVQRELIAMKQEELRKKAIDDDC